MQTLKFYAIAVKNKKIILYENGHQSNSTDMRQESSYTAKQRHWGQIYTDS